MNSATGTPQAPVRIRSALFEAIHTAPSPRSRAVVWSLSALLAMCILWISLAKVDIVAVADGRLVPQTYVKVVQPAEPGIVREILVLEGQRVRRNDVLLRLDPTLVSADHRASVFQLAIKQLDIRRIDAQLAGRPMQQMAGDDSMLLAQVRLDGVARERAQQDQLALERAVLARITSELEAARETLSKLERTLPSYEKTAQAYERLAGENLIGELEAEARRRDAIEHSQDFKSQQAYVSSLESSVTAQQRKLSQLDSVYRSTLQTERSQRVLEANQLLEDVGKQGFREGLLELRAPQDGVVKELATNTVGSVVQPGAVLLTLVPHGEPLQAEVYIRNEDVGFVREGERVRIKLAAYPFTKYGLLEGVVRVISADSSRAGASDGASTRETPSDSASPFKALIDLSRQHLDVNGRKLPIAAGMVVQAEIVERQRTVMEYLLSPIQKIADEAGRER